MPAEQERLRIKECAWCGMSVTRYGLYRHFSKECHSCPSPGTGKDFCTHCQRHLAASEFCKRAGRRKNIGHTCLECARKLRDVWAVKSIDNPAKPPRQVHPRPSASVFRPCRYCGVEQSAREIHKHQRQCPKNPINTPRPVRVNQTGDARHRAYEKYHYPKKYGITLDTYEQMVLERDGKCDICGDRPSGKTIRTAKLYVDHCHAPGGKIRGLLCHHCNLVIGQARDSVEVLDRAKSYLLAHRTS